MAGSPQNRKQCDFTKLMMKGYEVDLNNGNTTNFYVKFQAPIDTPFEGGAYRIHVELPEQYPFASPSIGFANKIFHPNIDERSGSVCLDVINQTWTPLYNLVNIFEVFLPQLLTYPNPTDPLNENAAALLMRDKSQYDSKVREYVQLYAREEDVGFSPSRSRKTSRDTEEDTREGDDMSDVCSELSGADGVVSDLELDMD
eukprot:gnl/MRDRNA2_/MRDRNA2_200223_c0_seq1.p1 gnl/MRDRNA2_/MRDRNA2_200223_c0~~gnl/MRDRNA2_/MRDRNA2_200223_c0_seq1.p1  ORF type:complete len:200 (-),score=22.68 gnl/MRDRNA2_/MRDRNA2_200223_c0_seq1:148-747(-)